MKSLWSFVSLLVSIQFVICRDFYLGMFRKNDFLVAQDNIYKPAAPFGFTTVTYGRLFKCPITYFRVVDRLGMGRGPITTIVRGGLRKKFISARIKSSYRLPISVNIYVGCENKKPSTRRTTHTTTHSTTHITTTKADETSDPNSSDTDSDPDSNTTDTNVATTEPEEATPDSGNSTGSDDENITGSDDGNVTDTDNDSQNSSTIDPS